MIGCIRLNIYMDSEFHKFELEMRAKNANIKQWEIVDAWLDKKHGYASDFDRVMKTQKPEENCEQMISDEQNRGGFTPKNYREDEESTDPNVQALNNQIKQMATKDPQIAQLGLTAQSIGKGPSAVYYVFGKQPVQGVAGAEASKWGGYSQNEAKKMQDDLTKLGPDGIKKHFSNQPNTNQPKQPMSEAYKPKFKYPKLRKSWGQLRPRTRVKQSDKIYKRRPKYQDATKSSKFDKDSD